MDKQKLIEKLEKEQEVATWRDLRVHSARGAILLIGNGISLAEVGAEFAIDNKLQVAKWITEQTIKKPDQDFLNDMEKNLEKQFSFIIIQPYVLIHELLN